MIFAVCRGAARRGYRWRVRTCLSGCMAEIRLRAAEGLLEITKPFMVKQLGMAGFIEEGRAGNTKFGCLLSAAIYDVMTRSTALLLHQLPTLVQMLRSGDGRLHHVVAFLAGSLGVLQWQQGSAPSRVLLIEGSEAFLKVFHDVSRMHGCREPLPLVANGASNLTKGMLPEVGMDSERLGHVGHPRIIGTKMARHAAVDDFQLGCPYLLDFKGRGENPLSGCGIIRPFRQQPIILTLVLLPLWPILGCYGPHQQQ